MEANAAAVPAKHVKIVELADNSQNFQAKEHSISVQQFESLLQEPGQVDCPLLEGIGFPVVIVSTTPGLECIPVYCVLTSPNPKNNWRATTATSLIETGLAPGCVVGNVYALRKDGKDFTFDEWWACWDVLRSMMDAYGYNPKFVMTSKCLDHYKVQVQRSLEGQGVSQPPASCYKDPSKYCWYCEDEDNEDSLFTCGKCKVAKYCSRECQKADWKAGHKQECCAAV